VAVLLKVYAAEMLGVYVYIEDNKFM